MADFLRFYGLDVGDLFRGKLSPRRAIALVEQLPPESATATAMRGGPDHAGWDRQAYIFADIFDAVATLTYVTIAANSKDPKKVKEPKPYPRPGSKKSSDEPDILLARLRGEELKSAEAGPGALVPLPPS